MEVTLTVGAAMGAREDPEADPGVLQGDCGFFQVLLALIVPGADTLVMDTGAFRCEPSQAHGAVMVSGAPGEGGMPLGPVTDANTQDEAVFAEITEPACYHDALTLEGSPVVWRGEPGYAHREAMAHRGEGIGLDHAPEESRAESPRGVTPVWSEVEMPIIEAPKGKSSDPETGGFLSQDTMDTPKSQRGHEFTGLHTQKNGDPGFPMEKGPVVKGLPSMEPRHLVQEMVERFRLIKAGDSQRMEVELKPEYLGRVTVKICGGDEGITAHLEVGTPEARVLLEQNLLELRQCLEGQGIKTGSLSVDIGQGYHGKQQNDGEMSMSRQSGPVHKESLSSLSSPGGLNYLV